MASWRLSRLFGAVSALLPLPVPPTANRNIDWAGGPGQSKEDAKWIDQQLSEFLLPDAKGNEKFAGNKDEAESVTLPERPKMK